ncbi:MAG: uncharacterized protein JWQ53_2546 [Klenkia sp.]|nr:uncharacterized protein [Klenkia sp.]
MTHSLDTPPTSGSASTADTAKDEARAVGQTTADAGKQVAGTAAEQAAEVAQETKKQAADLLSEGRSQAVDQARAGQAKAAESLTALAAELRDMTAGGSSGPAHDLVGQATGIVEDVAGRLRDREPGELLEDVRTFARRRPGAFLVGAALAGVLAGRLTSGIKASHADGSGSGPDAAGTPHAVTTGTGGLPAPVPPVDPRWDDRPLAGGQA